MEPVDIDLTEEELRVLWTCLQTEIEQEEDLIDDMVVKAEDKRSSIVYVDMILRPLDEKIKKALKIGEVDD